MSGQSESKGAAPPQDLDAEMALLGSLMMAEDCDWSIDDVCAVVSPEMFYMERHAYIFRALEDCHRDPGLTVDLIVLTDHMKKANVLDSVGGQVYLIELAESCADVANAIHYARIVLRKWQGRELIRLCDQARGQAFNATNDVLDLFSNLQDKSDKIVSQGLQFKGTTVRDAMKSLKHPSESRGRMVPLGLGTFGAIMDGGLDPSTLTVIGAQTSCGKSSLALNWCVYAAQHVEGCPCLMISLEMTNAELGGRSLNFMSGQSNSEVRRGKVGKDEFASNKRSVCSKDGWPNEVYLVDDVFELHAIVAVIRSYVRKQGVRLVIVDHLGLCRNKSSRSRTRNEYIGEITMRMKILAKELEISIVLVSQLKRLEENRPPVLRDLRDSGNIEQDADNVVLIWKNESKKLPDGSFESHLIVAKQRASRTGMAQVRYDLETQSYRAYYLEAAE